MTTPQETAHLGPDAERLVASLPAAAYVCDAPHGVVRVWNRLAADVWGREPGADMRFCGSLRLFRRDGSPVPHDASPAAHTLRTGEARSEVLVVERPDRSRVTVRVRTSPLRDPDGSIAWVVAVLEEPLALEMSPEPHPVSEVRYRAIVEDQPDLVCRFLADGTITFANEAYCSFFGVNRDAVIGQRYTPVVHPDDLPQVQALVESLSPTNPVVLIENRVMRGDGAVRWTQWTNRALYDEQGRLVEFQSAGRDITERKQVEEDAARLAAIVESAESAIFSMSLDGIIRSWNRAAERMFGYTAEEVLGQPNRIIVGPERLHESADILNRLQRGETVSHLETERVAKNGRRIPVSLTVSPIIGPSGRVIGISKIARDITQRKLAERELEERESRFRMMADHAPVLIWVADRENRGTYFNKPWLDFTGVPLERQVGNGWLMLIEPGDRAAAAAYCQQQFDRRQPFTMEFRLRHHSGEYRWVQDSGQPLFLPDGTFNGYIGTCLDIHERKTAEDRIRRILEGISDAFSAVDRRWRFTYVNEQYERLMGKTGEQLLGRVCWDVFSDAQRAVLHDVAHRAAREQRPARVEGYDPSLDLWFETRLYPTDDGLIAFTTDISERKRLEAARERAVQHESEARATAEEASRLKDEFLAVVSHELRTPLNAILGWARMLRDGSLGPDAVPKALATIERNARMQAQLVEDLLDVSRIVSGKLSLRVETVELMSVVHAAVEAVRPAARNKNIDLHLEAFEEGVTLSGDAGRLQQAIWNLLTNAVKFTPSRGRIDVQLRRSGEEAVVTVRDTGSGIPSQALPFIFDRFRQADSRTTRAHGGLGLGLTIVGFVVEAHGGTVHADSQGPGRGATFELRLPVREESGVAAPEVSTTRRPDLSRRHVLVVDDEPDAREIIRMVLEQCGATVATAASVAEAVALLGTRTPDLLISDIGMPEQDGYDLIRLVRAAPGLARIPAIALTAYADQRHRDTARELGYNAYLCKPVDPDAICGAIVGLCGVGS